MKRVVKQTYKTLDRYKIRIDNNGGFIWIENNYIKTTLVEVNYINRFIMKYYYDG